MIQFLPNKNQISPSKFMASGTKTNAGTKIVQKQNCRGTKLYREKYCTWAKTDAGPKLYMDKTDAGTKTVQKQNYIGYQLLFQHLRIFIYLFI